jgi:hypothetical protein
MYIFKKLFGTSYPKQELLDKQIDLINHLDITLIDLHKSRPIHGEMCVKMTAIPYRYTLMSVDAILKKLPLEIGSSYLPRSVAFIVDEDGNWVFLYAIRCDVGSDQVTTKLFIDALTRTNNAR